ncbi:uncharacterized protein LOC120980933 [Bufo bufo]|uniref:uncharacterized protein LOC120980933 n=1 Tax=Bufo bufo TaxID=8384 RepID=UPI001ABECAD7|nr:uncharacterized protein LOC120980933 [Bufo bufo]
MEGIHLLRDLLTPGDWMVKLDLKDAYLVPLAAHSRDLLRFLWRGETWRFTCLPFGLSSAPWCFTKLLRPVVSWLRSRGVRLIVYLDDILLMHESSARLLEHLRWTADLLTDLGFLLNMEKSCLIPSQRMEFLGFMAVFPARLHYRALQRLKIAHLRTGASFADVVVLDSEAREELRWWIANLEKWNGRVIVGFQPELTIESDASLQGWGAHCNGVSTGGSWSAAESRLHINALELLAGSFAVKSFSNGIANACNRLGGIHSATLERLAKEFWSFCLSRDIMVQAEYLPGLSNVCADGSDWQLDPEVFSAISDLWGPMTIDLFASRLNRQLTRFFSWRPDPEAVAVDAFLQDWSASRLYVFPPFAMIPRTLLQVRRHRADLVVVGDPSRGTSSSPASHGPPSQPSGPSPPTSPRRFPAAVGVPDLRTPRAVDGISEATRQLLDNAWAPGTRKSYRAAWRNWTSWCLEWDLDPVSAPVAHLLQFLTSLFEAGKAYRTINLFRSAISSTHLGYEGVPAGQHPSVSRLLRGSRLARPPQPRFSTTWDVSLVLSFLSSWPDNSALSLRQLFAKLLALFCLISCKRVSDVRALDFDARSFTPEGVTFNISRRTKTNIRSVSYPSFPSAPVLCPVACLREYESRTRAHRSPDMSQLFLSIAILLDRFLVRHWHAG